MTFTTDAGKTTLDLEDMDRDARYDVITDLIKKQAPEFCSKLANTIRSVGGNPTDVNVGFNVLSHILPELGLLYLASELKDPHEDDCAILERARKVAVLGMKAMAEGLEKQDMLELIKEAQR